MISNIIEILHKGDYYNGTKEVEFAKGSDELVTDLKGFKRKVKRKWHTGKK